MENIGYGEMDKDGTLMIPETIQKHLGVKPGQYVLLEPREDSLIMVKMDEESIPVRTDLYQLLTIEAQSLGLDPVKLLNHILQKFLTEQH